MTQNLSNLSKGVEKAINTVPELYADAFQPAVQESGKTLSLIPRTINAALSYLRQWIAEKEYNVAETEKLLAQKLEKVGQEKIVEPEPYVAVPAFQAISYSMNNDELRNLYANLLAKSMMSDTKEFVHPCFVEIIKQMAPIDALVFKTIMERKYNPIVDLIYEKRDDSSFVPAFATIATNITDIDVAPECIVSMSIDNLLKHHLITLCTDSVYTDEDLYAKILDSEYYKHQQQTHPDTEDGYKFSCSKYVIEKTALGKLFYSICVDDTFTLAL